MTTPTDPAKLADEIEGLAKKATPTPWEADSEKDDNRVHYAVMLSPEGHSMFDSMNTDYRVGLIETESDGEYVDQWDETARRNFALIALLRNSAPTIVAALRELEAAHAREAKLREALEPFAADAALWDGPDSLPLVEAAPGYSDALTVGDLRRARAALGGEG